MGIHIYVNPKDVWNVFQKNRDKLEKEMVAIAENIDTEFAVYLTEEATLPKLIIYKGENKEYSERIISKDDCLLTAKRMYTKYLFPIAVKDGVADFEHPQEYEDAYEPTRSDIDDFVYEREDELYMAALDFLQVLSDSRTSGEFLAQHGDGIIGIFLDDICEYLANEHSIPILRPMFIEDEMTGEEIFVEYPYDETVEMEMISDGDNIA